MPDLLNERQGTTLVLTMNRPEVRNAATEAMYFAIADGLDEASRDMDIRAVVLTGAGDAFCSGADTKRVRSETGVFEGTSAPSTRQAYHHGVQRMSLAFGACEVPVIAAVNGPAIGLGLDLATASDIRIASETAVFSEAFITLGLIPGDGGFWYLPRVVGYSRAIEMTTTGKRVDATTAERWGLVSQVVPAGEALNAALTMAGEIGQRSPHAVRISKRLIREAMQTTLHTALEMGALAQAVLTGSADQRESVAALMERRTGEFKAR